MYIASVIPIERGIPFDILTYYAHEALAPGTLVLVPFGRQHIHGFVTETTPLAEAKAFVKQAAFSLKKIKEVVGHIPFFESIVAALKDTGTATLAPVGAVAATVIPHILFEHFSNEKLSDILTSQVNNDAEIQIDQTIEEQAISGPRTERIDTYKRIIRSSFAAKKSVLFITPTIRSLEWWKSQLEKGIGRHVAIFHSKGTKKDIRSYCAILKQKDLPLLVFATPNFATLPINSLGTIIAEDEGSNLYKSNDRFEIDTRTFLKYFASRVATTLIWGDMMPRFETLHRCKADHLPRTFVPDKLHIVPIEHYRTILPTEVIELIRHAEKRKRRLFLYTNRKGVAPLSRCSDCGTIVTCEKCELPMALRNRSINGATERYFICLHCSATLSATHTCVYCSSWNITPVSIGTESIRDAVISIAGDESVVVIDDDITPDSKMIDELLSTIEKKKFAVVIGTQKALPFIKKIHYSIIPFFDRLLSIPSLYATEHTIRLIMECNEASSEGVILCTKTPDFPLIRQLEMQKINAIIHDELELRRELGYPPFGSLIKISMTVPDGYRTQINEEVTEYLHEFDYTTLPARRVSAGSMKALLQWLIKVDTNFIEEEGQNLGLFLGSLRFPYKIEENPERL